MIAESMRKHQAYLTKLEQFFADADTSGDGLISFEELQGIIADPQVEIWLRILGLEVHETTLLFNLIDDGDGLITIDEFLRGVTRLKGQSRSLDVIAIQHQIE